uniref:Bromo domain-containing protein n=1 Tax=Strigamia maritima TaxID=126957 RepID=T1J4R7_STRMM
MWPMLLDMSRDECKRMLRRLELEAYSAIVSAFRAQGDLSKDKKKILQDLCSVLSISTERHRAEIRRAVNDEHLSTIADQMVGPNTASEWAIEGRRLIPLMPRLVPQTAFTAVATQVANIAAVQNAQMLPPNATGSKFSEGSTTTIPSPTAIIGTPVSVQNQSPISVTLKHNVSPRPASPTSLAVNNNNNVSVGSNVVILPSGMSVHVRGQNGAIIEDERGRKRRRSSSVEHSASQKPISPTREPSPSLTNQNSKVLGNTARSLNVPMSGTPVKITFTSASTPQKLTTSVTNAPTQKVFLVSGSGLPPSLLQRVPIVKTVTTTRPTHTVAQSKTTSLIMPFTSTTQSSMPTTTTLVQSNLNGNVSTIVTLATTSTTHSISNVSASTLSTSSVSGTLSSTGNTFSISKGRGGRQKGKIGTATGLMIPVVSQSQSGIQLKPVVTNKPSIQVKNDAGLKIITQTMPVVTASVGNAKILPKPATVSSTPLVMMSTASNISTITKSMPSSTAVSGAISGTRVVNVITSAQASARVPGSLTTPNKLTAPASTVVSVNPKNLQQGLKMTTLTSARYKNMSDVGGSSTAPALIMVGPKTLQSTTVKMLSKGTVGTNAVARSAHSVTSAKPNLIVVQKAQVMSSSTGSGTIATAGGSNSTTQTIVKQVSAFANRGQGDKEILSFIQRGEKMKLTQSQASAVSMATTLVGEIGKTLTGQQISSVASTSGQSVVLVEVTGQSKIEEETNGDQKNTVLADILQATGILPDNQQTSQSVCTVTDYEEETPVAESLDTDEKLTEIVNENQKETLNGQQVYKWVSQGETQQQQVPAFVEVTAGVEGKKVSGDEGENDAVVPSVNMFPFGLQESQMMEIQAAADVLGHKGALNEEAIAVLTQAGFDFKKLAQPTEILDGGEIKEDLSETKSHSEGDSKENEQNVKCEADALRSEAIGQLDPQTGIFYPDSNTCTTPKSSSQEVREEVEVVQDKMEEQSTEIATNLDIFSTAIETAQLDLRQFHFTDDVIRIDERVVLQKISEKSELESEPEKVKTVVEETPCVATEENVQERLINESKERFDILETQESQNVEVFNNSSVISDENVIIEPSGIEITTMVVDDFTSQRIEDVAAHEFIDQDVTNEVVLSSEQFEADEVAKEVAQDEFGDSYGEESASDNVGDELGPGDNQGSSGRIIGDLFENQNELPLDSGVRSSKRKRKAPNLPDDIPPSLSGWAKLALGLLSKVSNYRGLRRGKNELNASHWFLRPVSPAVAPDYYKVIEKPMDFSTIRKNLEGGIYDNLSEFHRDMTQIKLNCEIYNPPDHPARLDCNEVFIYYDQEFERIMDKLTNKAKLTGSSTKKPKPN